VKGGDIMSNGQQQYQQPPQQPSQQQQPVAGGPGEDKVLAAICYIPVIGAIIYFVKKDSQFVTFHAKQGTVLTIIWIVLWILSGILFWVFWPLYWVVGIVEFVFGILALIGLIQAATGKWWKMPVIGDFAEKFGQSMQQPPQQRPPQR